MDAILGKYGSLIVGALYICAWLDAVLPPPAATSRWVPVRKLLHLAAANVGNARNAIEHRS